jgi:hypothetical protein
VLIDMSEALRRPAPAATGVAPPRATLRAASADPVVAQAPRAATPDL